MRKWLVILIMLLAVAAAGAWWLAGKAKDARPEPGPVSLEVDNVL